MTNPAETKKFITDDSLFEEEKKLRGADFYLTPGLLEEFKQIYRREFGVLLSDEDALSRAITFLNLFEAIYRPIPSDDRASCQQSGLRYNEGTLQGA